MLVLCRRLAEGFSCGNRYTIMVAGVRPGMVLLDVAGQSPEARSALRQSKVRPSGKVWCRENEALVLDGGTITVTPKMVSRSGTRLGIEAPSSIRIARIDAPIAEAAA